MMPIILPRMAAFVSVSPPIKRAGSSLWCWICGVGNKEIKGKSKSISYKTNHLLTIENIYTALYIFKLFPRLYDLYFEWLRMMPFYIHSNLAILSNSRFSFGFESFKA
jgi:hypothetical protein